MATAYDTGVCRQEGLIQSISRVTAGRPSTHSYSVGGSLTGSLTAWLQEWLPW
jgi:hypothetical protein